MYLSNEQLTTPTLHPCIGKKKISSLWEQGSGFLNEDVLLRKGDLFGVFDGATSLDKRQFQSGKTGGYLAATAAAQSFHSDSCSLDLLAEKANEKIRQAQLHENINLQKRHTLWSTSIAVIRLEENRFEYCQTGDSLIVLVLKNGGYKLVTPDIDIDRDTLRLWKEMKISPNGTVYELLAKQIQKVRQEMNVNYGVLNGEPQALQFINHGYEDLSEVSDILIFTDGLQLPRENPQEENDWQLFVELYRSGGLQNIRDHVRKLQQQDPNCRTYPRFKCHDDIAAVAINC